MFVLEKCGKQKKSILKKLWEKKRFFLKEANSGGSNRR
jgi:hypothetical protein